MAIYTQTYNTAQRVSRDPPAWFSDLCARNMGCPAKIPRGTLFACPSPEKVNRGHTWIESLGCVLVTVSRRASSAEPAGIHGDTPWRTRDGFVRIWGGIFQNIPGLVCISFRGCLQREWCKMGYVHWVNGNFIHLDRIPSFLLPRAWWKQLPGLNRAREQDRVRQHEVLQQLPNEF